MLRFSSFSQSSACTFPLVPVLLMNFANVGRRVTGVVLIFVEIPLLLRICPTSEKFDTFVRRFNENWPRAGMYIALSAVQFCSIIFGASSLIAAAVVLFLTGACYSFAALRGQEFTSSSTLGGQGVAQMIV